VMILPAHIFVSCLFVCVHQSLDFGTDFLFSEGTSSSAAAAAAGGAAGGSPSSPLPSAAPSPIKGVLKNAPLPPGSPVVTVGFGSSRSRSGSSSKSPRSTPPHSRRVTFDDASPGAVETARAAPPVPPARTPEQGQERGQGQEQGPGVAEEVSSAPLAVDRVAAATAAEAGEGSVAATIADTAPLLPPPPPALPHLDINAAAGIHVDVDVDVADVPEPSPPAPLVQTPLSAASVWAAMSAAIDAISFPDVPAIAAAAPATPTATTAAGGGGAGASPSSAAYVAAAVGDSLEQAGSALGRCAEPYLPPYLGL